MPDINTLPLFLLWAAVTSALGYFIAHLRLQKKLQEANQQQAQQEQQQQHLQETLAQLEELNQNKQKLEQELQDLKTQQAVQTSQLEAEQQQKHDLQQEKNQLSEKLSKEQENNSALNATRAELENSQKALRLEVDELKKERQQYQERLEANNKELQELHARRAELESSQKDLREEITELKQVRDDHEKRLEEAHKTEVNLQAKLREQETNLQAREEKLTELQQQFTQQKTALKDEFKALSEQILTQRQKALKEQNTESLSSLLQPLKNQIEGFQKRVNDVHGETLKGHTNLEAEIRKILDVGLKMREEASNLTTALKGNSQQRGAWGEAQLERTLEMSGLLEEDHYQKQTSFKDAEGKTKQTDYLILLPDNKQIIIDSKVSLNAYDQAIAAKTPDEYKRALDEHVKAIKNHITDLANKDYTNLTGMHSPSFVLMFMPIEAAYIEALKHNKDLFSYGYAKNIVLVSHTTLIPILRTVSNLWMLEKSNSEAREVSAQAGEIYNKVSLVADRLNKLGNTLGTASKHYNDTVTALAGQQGLYGKVERFNQLSSKVSKTLPQVEPKHCDFQNERLGLIAQALTSDEKND